MSQDNASPRIRDQPGGLCSVRRSPLSSIMAADPFRSRSLSPLDLMPYRGPIDLLRVNAGLGGAANKARHIRRREVLAALSSPLQTSEDARNRLAELLPEALVRGFVSPHQAAQLNKSLELWLKSETVRRKDYIEELEAMVDELKAQLADARRSV